MSPGERPTDKAPHKTETSGDKGYTTRTERENAVGQLKEKCAENIAQALEDRVDEELCSVLFIIGKDSEECLSSGPSESKGEDLAYDLCHSYTETQERRFLTVSETNQ